MILTRMPDLPPGPETAANRDFRQAFYARWGRGNWIVSGWSCRAEYAPYRQTLSIKLVSSGRERYYVDRRHITVTDDTWLVLNEGREYASLLEGPARAHSFAIFVRPGLPGEVAHAANQSLADGLDDGRSATRTAVEFDETLRLHDRRVTPLLDGIRSRVAAGERSPAWLEEQCQCLVARIIELERRRPRIGERLEQVRPSTRLELGRRLGWAVDFMLSNLSRELTLAEIAEAARLSTYHFLRVFRQAHRCTPTDFLRQQRLLRAAQLLESRTMTICEITARVGLSRTTLWRHARRLHAPGRIGPDQDADRDLLRTTTVPASLSCHPCLRGSKATQTKPIIRPKIET